MREACEGQAVRLGAKPLAYTLNPINRGWAGGGVAPSARSTPTRAQRGTRPKTKHLLYLILN
ncbi:MAG: hypothetical protein NZ455_07380 [Bacteroidia bacterium]|nr:hypothetical protein [Bacteroidia bacterium]MDW8348290.1 hypothetical protein [Bacteroidia bacterium]